MRLKGITTMVSDVTLTKAPSNGALFADNLHKSDALHTSETRSELIHGFDE